MRRVGQFMREAIVSFAAALQFLTIAAPLVRRSFSDRELGRAVGFFPLIGLLLGGTLAGVDWLLDMLWHGNPLHIAIILGLWVVLTGALHVDGLLDTCDGLLGGNNPDERLRIMRDPHVGSFAVVGAVLLLLLKFTALSAIHYRREALLLAPTLGRWCMCWAMVRYPYARPEGLGRAMKDNAARHDLVLATIIAGVTIIVVAFFTGPLVPFFLPATLLATTLLINFTLRRIPGLTGDVYGAICELTELLVLVLMASPLIGTWQAGPAVLP